MKKTCLFPECEDEVYSRGLCNTHYCTASRLVGTKKTSWKKLESEGKCLPKSLGIVATHFLTSK